GAGQFRVLGEHTYGAIGQYQATVTITSLEGLSTTTTSYVSIATQLFVSPHFVQAEQDHEYTTELASFTDTQPGEAGDYSATIQWAGASPLPALVTSYGDGHFGVLATYDFGAVGYRAFTIKVTNPSRVTEAEANGTVHVLLGTLLENPFA